MADRATTAISSPADALQVKGYLARLHDKITTALESMDTVPVVAMSGSDLTVAVAKAAS